MSLTILTVNEAAKLLRVNPDAVRGYIHTGELSAARVGRGYRIDLEDLRAFWNARVSA